VGDDDYDDDLLVPREKTKDEMEREEEEYREFLQTEVGEDLADLVTVEAGAMTQEEEGCARKKMMMKKKESKGDGSGNSKEENDQEFLMK
jgi:protein KRI1